MLRPNTALLVGCAICASFFLGSPKDANATAIINTSSVTTGGTLIDFEGFSDFQNADNLFVGQGVTFEADFPPGNTVIRHDPNPDYVAFSGIGSLRNPNTAPTDLNMNFSGARQAVEFYFADRAPLANYVFTALGAGDAFLDSVTLTPPELSGNGNFVFVTFLRPSADILKITVDSLTVNQFSTDYYGIDDLRLDGSAAANDVPEPAALTMFGLGLLGLYAARRRKPRV